MALGFQDCCNSSSYFFLNGIPATVSQNEFYHIITLEGPAFCATYTNIPALNYQPPTYTLVEMTEYTSCDTCFAGAPLTCPAQETIFLSQFGPGSISVGTDCSIRTLFPMIVECFSTNPTFDGFADGVVRLFVTGGTPPYSFFNLIDGTVFGGALPVVNSTYTLIDGALEGEYPIQVVDAQSDFNITVNCVLESPPTILTLVATTTPVSIAGNCDGTLSISVTEGTPPYQIFVNGLPETETNLVDLCAGDYEITAIDSGVGTDQQITSTTVTIGSPAAIIYSDRLCLSFSYCGTRFALTFTRSGDYNFRANYTCDNPDDVGLTTLILRWEAGWTTTQETSNGNLAFEVPCAQPLPSLLVQFTKLSNQTEQPTGNWRGPLGLFQGINATVDPGVCVASVPVDPIDPPAQPILTFTTNNAQCGQVLGSVILVGSGGAGGPYQYSVNGVLQGSSTVQLPTGNYVATTTDSIGTVSSSVSFNIGTTPSVNVNINLTTSVDTSFSYFDESAANNPAGCSPCGLRESFHPVKTVVNVTGVDPLASSVNIYGYFLVTIKKQSVFNDSYLPSYQLLPSSEEIPISVIGAAGTNVLPPPATYYGPPQFNPVNESPSNAVYTYQFTSSPLVVTESARPFAINNNLIPVNQSSSCPANSNNITRTLIQEIQIGTVAEPVYLTDPGTIDGVTFFFNPFVFYIPINNIFRPTSSAGCQPAGGVEIDVQFVRTSPNTACTNIVFNNGVNTYVASAKLVGDDQYLPQIYTNTVIIN
jgi:hypothetical protein